MACFSCMGHSLSPVFKSLSIAAAKAAKAKLRGGGMLSRSVDLAGRKAICAACPMRQMYGGRAYCGPPLLRKVNRRAASEGCGCPIDDKAADPGEHCPINRNFDPAGQAAGRCDCKWCTR